MKNYFSTADFLCIEKLMLAFNQTKTADDIEKYTDEFLQRIEVLREGYKNFSIDLRKNGELCSNLMTFIEKITII